jgi:iron complex outermembrane receptor protein
MTTEPTAPVRSIGALLLGFAGCLALPAAADAQQATDETTGEAVEQTDGGAYRLSAILVDAGFAPDDDARSVVARELWVGGKVATSILDTPASVSVVTADEMRRRNVQTVEEALSYTPGIISDYFGSDDRNDYYLVRGFQASTYRDGLTLGSMRGVREQPYAYERVEVIKGANSTLFGASDPGGSVNFVTKTPRFAPMGEAYLQAGSFERREAGFDVTDALSDTVAFRLTGKIRDSDREYAHSRDDERFLMGGLTWEPTPDTTLTFVLDRLERDASPNSGGYPLDRAYDRGLFFGEPDFNYHETERTTATAMLRHDFGGGFSVSGNLRYSDMSDDFGYVYLSDTTGRVGTVVDRFAFGSDSAAQELIGNAIAKYDRSFGLIDSSTLVGLEYRRASTSAVSFYDTVDPIDIANPVYSGRPTGLSPYSDRDGRQTTRSAFLQQNLSFNDRLIATVGLRNDWMRLSSRGEEFGAAIDESGSFSELSLRGALTWKITDQVSTYVSFVESVAPPSIGVAPERGEQYEVGIKYQPAGVNALISAAVFDLTKKDITVAVVQGDGTITRELIGETRVRGFEVEGKAELFENLTLIGGYAFTQSEILRSNPIRGVDVEGNAFATTPRHTASVWANYVVPGQGARGDITFGLGARYVGAYYFNQQNDNGRSDPTVLFDASVGYQLTDNVALVVNASNLLDEQHVVGRGTADYYNPGREVMATLRYTW